MSDFSCTIWQFIVFGFSCFSCLCGGISLGMTIDRYIWKREIDKLTEESIKMVEESDNK